MRATTMLWAAALGLVLSSATPGVERSAFAKEQPPKKAAAAKKPKAKKKPVTSCVRFSQAADSEGRTITFTIDNRCDQELSCSISWVVTCEKEDAATTESHDESSVLGAGQDADFRASAEVCGDDAYVISAPKWSCKTPSSNTASAKP